MPDIEDLKSKAKKNSERATKIVRSESPHLTQKQRNRAKLYCERNLGKLEAYDELTKS